MTDPHRLIGSLQRAGVRLALDTTDLSLLVALKARAERDSLVSFEEEELYSIFEQVFDLTEPDAQNPRKRATYAIQRLREQRLLSRVDGVGLAGPGEYSMTRLAIGIVDFFTADEALTRESLALLTKTLASQLTEVLREARTATDADKWRLAVVNPLRITIGELVAGIERRQRGLDDQQDEIRAEIGRLIQRDWFAAIEQSESLLERTTRTLQELNEVLLQDAGHLQSLLQEIEQLASQAGAKEAEAAAQRVSEQVDRVAAWGGARLRSWSDYYQLVQRYLRDVVRLDPERALSQRLRDQLANWPDQRFHLWTARSGRIRLLRDVDAKHDRPPVRRPRENRDRELAITARADPMEQLAARVAAALADGARTLADVVVCALPSVPTDEQYRAAGNVIALVARNAVAEMERERPWRRTIGKLHIEDWSITPKEKP